jgi:DNA-binding NarL/FixJ family response regulator
MAVAAARSGDPTTRSARSCSTRCSRPAPSSPAGGPGTSPTTDRETDVLRAAAEGLSTEEIGDAVSLSPATVRNYLSYAITKTGARNRIDAIRIARDAGWL